MTYRISYHDSSAGARRDDRATRTEYFRAEHEALMRARELVEDGDHQGVCLCDETGRVSAGVPLQLKLGLSTAE